MLDCRICLSQPFPQHIGVENICTKDDVLVYRITADVVEGIHLQPAPGAGVVQECWRGWWMSIDVFVYYLQYKSLMQFTVGQACGCSRCNMLPQCTVNHLRLCGNCTPLGAIVISLSGIAAAPSLPTLPERGWWVGVFFGQSSSSKWRGTIPCYPFSVRLVALDNAITVAVPEKVT